MPSAKGEKGRAMRDRKAARVVRHYGGGGRPKPGECRCVTMSCTCEACGLHIGHDDAACKHCGATLDGVADFEDLSNEPTEEG